MTKEDLKNLSEYQQHLLMESASFCMLPWVHLHAYPDGKVYPCCLAVAELPIGNLKEESMEEVWHNDIMQNDIRYKMLNDQQVKHCAKCYEQEENGFFSMRNAANKHHGHLLKDDKVKITQCAKDSIDPDFKLRHWDVRFSNLCNFKCRSCGPQFSSQWYDDEKALWNNNNTESKILFAGKTKTDALEQLMEHIDYVEQIYFAGGEPLIMEEHYIILKELVKRGKTDVTLVYNTNFSEMAYKDQNVLEVWKDFKKVAVGASLDASGDKAEYMRKGTVWSQTCKNRELMIKECPHVDFYISPTVSIFNAMHVSQFHLEWMELGLLGASDININILQGPNYYRIDCLPHNLKERTQSVVKAHINYIDEKDKLRRAVTGFESMITFMNAQDNTKHLGKFHEITKKLDAHRKESFYEVFPELEELKKYE